MNSQKNPELSIILPVHNAAKLIGKITIDVEREVKTLKIPYEIIFVENASRDDSLEVVRKLVATHKNTKLTQSSAGWGTAIAKGLSIANGNYLCYIVTNGQIDPHYIVPLYQKIKEKNVAMVKIRRINRDTLTRLFTSYIFNFLSITLFGIHSLDINGTPKLLKSGSIKNKKFISKNAAFDLELLLYLKSKHLKWLEIPAIYKTRTSGKSTTNLKTAIEIIKEMIKFRFGLA